MMRFFLYGKKIVPKLEGENKYFNSLSIFPVVSQGVSFLQRLLYPKW